MVIARLLAILVLALSCACAAAPAAGAGAAAGVWAYDQYSDAGGEIVLAHPPDSVYAAAEAVARARGMNVNPVPGSQRVECTVDKAEVSFTVIVVPGADNVARLRVYAREPLRARGDLARDLALQVQLRLDPAR
ncbi:MAG: hypothetical protein EYC70_04495 [Planctomycetota bacterium]|nr:MAG: hypothetical protein EYC70_04495 [Planctomycetota bacterium]